MSTKIRWEDLATRSLGTWGERLAAAHYRTSGAALVARNWRVRQGEIDLVLAEEETRTLVFVEVKTRRTQRCGSGFEAVDWRKQLRLRQLVGIWLAENQAGAARIRIDICDVFLPTTGPAQLRILRGAA